MRNSIGSAIDGLYELRAMRSLAEKEVEKMKMQERELENFIFLQLQTLDLTSAKGNIAMFSYKKDIMPNVTDWNAVYRFIAEHQAWTLLHKRIGATTWKEYLEDKILVPGTEEIQLIKPHLRKIP